MHRIVTLFIIGAVILTSCSEAQNPRFYPANPGPSGSSGYEVTSRPTPVPAAVQLMPVPESALPAPTQQPVAPVQPQPQQLVPSKQSEPPAKDYGAIAIMEAQDKEGARPVAAEAARVEHLRNTKWRPVTKCQCIGSPFCVRVFPEDLRFMDEKELWMDSSIVPYRLFPDGALGLTTAPNHTVVDYRVELERNRGLLTLRYTAAMVDNNPNKPRFCVYQQVS